MATRRRDAAPDDPFAAIGCDEVLPIGAGGSSLVYRARQPAFNRLVALKVLSTPLVDERARRRFERELALAGHLTGHPNVVTVFASGFLGDGRAYVEMEYCPGGSLADLVAAHGPLPVRDVVAIGVKMAGVLELARVAGIVHRDIKPANVLVTRFGEPALADFGIAIVAGEMTGTTQALTPIHAAPEVLDARGAGPAADQWSLGSTLHTLLAGRAPFATADDEGLLSGMLRILNDPVPSIARADVPDTLRSVLARAMAKDPGQRWPGPLELGQALQEVERRQGWPVTTLPVDEVFETRYRGPDPSAIAASPGHLDPLMTLEAAPSPRGGTIWPESGAGPGPEVGGPTVDWDRRLAVRPPISGGPAPGQDAHDLAGEPHRGQLDEPALVQPAPGPVVSESAERRPATLGTGTPMAGAPGEVTQHFLRARRAPRAETELRPSEQRAHHRIWVAAAAATLVVVAVVVATTLATRSSNRPQPSTRPVIPPSNPLPTRLAPVELHVISEQPTSVTLQWKDPSDGIYQYVVQVIDVTNPRATNSATQTVVTGLDPTRGYCFTVGAVYDPASQPAYAAVPACIRGATASPPAPGAPAPVAPSGPPPR